MPFQRLEEHCWWLAPPHCHGEHACALERMVQRTMLYLPQAVACNSSTAIEENKSLRFSDHNGSLLRQQPGATALEEHRQWWSLQRMPFVIVLRGW